MTGWSRPGDFPPSRTFLYDNGQVMDVGAGSFSFPQDMNESGQIIGGLGSGGGSTSFLYSQGEVTRIVGFPSSYSTAVVDINDRGQVLGHTAELPMGDGRSASFIFSDGQVRLLPDRVGFPLHLNELGHVVGLFGTGGGVNAFFYSDDDGRFTDLTQWLMASFDDVASVGSDGASILLNDLGQIALPATLDNGQWTIFVLTPIPEPATYALMLTGAGVLAAIARRRRASSMPAPIRERAV